jgi:hypothetical protein
MNIVIRLYYVCIYALFNESASNSKYVAPDAKIINK